MPHHFLSWPCTTLVKLLISLQTQHHLHRQGTDPPVSVEAEKGGHLFITQLEVKDLEKQEFQKHP